ncbi:MAG: S-layer homology domain-containing protein, partial [Xenococcus sp. (in: cyanobacteria)]
VISEPESQPEVVTTELGYDSELEKPTIVENETDTGIESDSGTEEKTGTEARPSVVANAIAFSDVNEQYWAYPFIAKLAAEKLIPDADSFDPDAPITRAGMAGLINQAFKDSPAIAATKQFKDVPTDDNEVVEDINKAVAIGFMKGYSDEQFSPEQNIPRYQVLVALATGLQLEPSGDTETILENFGDREILPPWSLDKVAAATEAGFVINRPGFEPTSLKPNEPATRAEVAAMIYQSLANSGKLPVIESEYITPQP